MNDWQNRFIWGCSLVSWIDFQVLKIFVPICLAGKLLSTLLCCKSLCYQITLMGGTLMCARSKFMALDRASPYLFLALWLLMMKNVVWSFWNCALQEPYSTSAISVYFKGVHYLCFYQMRNGDRHKKRWERKIEPWIEIPKSSQNHLCNICCIMM